MARVYSYVVEHDQGFAPNPFWGLCTLANCKPRIRKAAEVGDFVVGTGSAEIRAAGRLIYWMRVAEILSFDEYWSDTRFARKKPVMRGSWMQRYGDNIYCTGPDGAYQQIDSFHSENDGSLSIPNRTRDTSVTSKVLIANEFAYYGKSAPAIPNALGFMIIKGRGHRCRFSCEQVGEIQRWLRSFSDRGYVDEPGRWP